MFKHKLLFSIIKTTHMHISLASSPLFSSFKRIERPFVLKTCSIQYNKVYAHWKYIMLFTIHTCSTYTSCVLIIYWMVHSHFTTTTQQFTSYDWSTVVWSCALHNFYNLPIWLMYIIDILLILFSVCVQTDIRNRNL